MLIKGETDCSSYPNSSLHVKYQAGGSLSINITSLIFLRGDTIFNPLAFVSYYDTILDKKMRLLHSNVAISSHGKHLLAHLGVDVGDRKVVSNIGFE